MPTITKQTTRAPTVQSGSVLDRIAPVKATNVGRLKFALYGVPKVGKTRFACTFAKPLLLVGAEDGTASIVGTKGIDFVQLRSAAEMGEIIAGPLRSGKYASVVLDTASKLRDMRIAEILGLASVPEQKGWGFASRDQWMQCSQNMKDLLRPLLDLPRVMDLNVVVISQEQNLNEFAQSDSDLIRPVVGSALGKSVSDWLHAECDYIGQMLIREGTALKEVSINGKKSQVKERTGQKEYCLRVGTDGVYQAGFRLPEGRVLSSDFIVDPTYEKILKIIKGG